MITGIILFCEFRILHVTTEFTSGRYDKMQNFKKHHFKFPYEELLISSKLNKKDGTWEIHLTVFTAIAKWREASK